MYVYLLGSMFKGIYAAISSLIFLSSSDSSYLGTIGSFLEGVWIVSFFVRSINLIFDLSFFYVIL